METKLKSKSDRTHNALIIGLVIIMVLLATNITVVLVPRLHAKLPAVNTNWIFILVGAIGAILSGIFAGYVITRIAEQREYAAKLKELNKDKADTDPIVYPPTSKLSTTESTLFWSVIALFFITSVCTFMNLFGPWILITVVGISFIPSLLAYLAMKQIGKHRARKDGVDDAASAAAPVAKPEVEEDDEDEQKNNYGIVIVALIIALLAGIAIYCWVSSLDSGTFTPGTTLVAPDNGNNNLLPPANQPASTSQTSTSTNPNATATASSSAKQSLTVVTTTAIIPSGVTQRGIDKDSIK